MLQVMEPKWNGMGVNILNAPYPEVFTGFHLSSDTVKNIRRDFMCLTKPGTKRKDQIHMFFLVSLPKTH